MQVILQDPYTMEFANSYNDSHKIFYKLKEENVETIIGCADSFIHYSIQALSNKTPINIKEIGKTLNALIQNQPASNHLLVIHLFLYSVMHKIHNLPMFRSVIKHFQKDLLYPILSIPSLMPLVKNKNYTDILIQTISLDLNSYNYDNKLESAQIFIKNIEDVFEDLRKLSNTA
jgi:hypothetical protein